MLEAEDKQLHPITIEDEMKRSYLDYAMSVIVSRAIPDVRDGLKPVHRRILYSMYEAGYHSNRQYRKSARIVGDVIGKYHPHGDSAVYDSLVRMAQNFSLRVMLVDGQGNFGSIDGDSPAAMRYTESRLAKPAHKLLEDIDKNTVNFNPNYDGSETEPTVLPAMYPNLLVNGAGGIAVGMATNIPPHNLSDIIDACCHYVDHPDCSIDDLIEIVQGPDFPTAAMIVGTNGIRSAYHTGRGSIVMRGRTEIEELDNGRFAIIITEVPYMVNKARLVEKIAELVKEKRIEAISDLRDESDKSGIRVVVELKRDTTPEVVLNQLHSYTQLQTSFGVIMLALDDGMPKVMNLKEVLAAFAKFREEVITRRVIFQLDKARNRAHILMGLRLAVSNIDEVIKIVRGSSDPNEAKEKLIALEWQAKEIASLIKLVDPNAKDLSGGIYKLSEAQAKAILDMRLHRLTALEKDKLEEELAALAENIKELLSILESRAKLLAVLKEELLQVKEEHGTPRLTEIIEGEVDQDIESLIEREEMVVTVTLGGYIKRVPLATYRAQKRGGKGRSGLSMKEEDVLTEVFVGSTHTPLLFFTNTGQVYSLKLYKLPLGNPQSKGRPLVNILSLSEGEHVTNIMPMPENQDEWDEMGIIFATAKGNIRRNSLLDFKRVQSNGKIAIRMDEDDSLIGVRVCKEDEHILLVSKNGKALRCPVQSVRIFKSRTSDGVRGMKLAGDDRVISMSILDGAEYEIAAREEYLSVPIDQRQECKFSGEIPSGMKQLEVLSSEEFIRMATAEQLLLSVSSRGFGKISSAYSYRITNRGGSGVVNMVLSDKTGSVVASMPVLHSQELMLITDTGKLIRCKLENIRVTGRSTSGVILFKLNDNEQIVSTSLIADSSSQEDDDETDATTDESE